MFRVDPVHCGTIESLPKDIMTYLTDSDVRIDSPVLSFLITSTAPDDDRVILVDTGVERQTDDDGVAGRTVAFGGPEPFVRALDARGLEPADVDQVILTHLHHDHAANCALFPEAEFIVQSREVRTARDPPPFARRAYFRDHVSRLDASKTRVIDGDFRLCPGIDLLLTPGHSPGLQSVRVATEDGDVAIVSDLADCKHNLDPRRTQITDANGTAIEVTPVDADYLPPGFHTNVERCYESIERVYANIGSAGTVLGGHDADLIRDALP